MKYDSYFFDMDETLTESKTVITDEMRDLLLQLNIVIIVSGASKEQMEKQVPGFIHLAQNGNESPFWKNTLREDEVKEIREHIKTLGYPINQGTFENRGCQVAFSLVGHNAPRDKKKVFDPDKSKRRNLLKEKPFNSKTLTVKIGGTTTLDYIRKNGTKGDNVKRLIKMFGYKKPIYVGDALFEGGNDESVIGVCETKQVYSLEDTKEFIKNEI